METQFPAKHSGIGIASFILSVFTLVSLFVVFGIMAMAMASGGLNKDTEMGTGLALVVTWLLTVIGFGLGIAGAITKNSNKVFSVLGIVFSASTIIISIAVIALGMAMTP